MRPRADHAQAAAGALEPAPRPRVGPRALRDETGARGCPERRPPPAGGRQAAPRAARAPAAARLGLCGPAPTRGQTPGAARRDVLAAVVGLGGAWGARPPRARALEATPGGQRLVGRAMRVVERGGALPGAGVLRPAGTQPAGRRAGRRRWRWRRPACPPGWTV